MKWIFSRRIHGDGSFDREGGYSPFRSSHEGMELRCQRLRQSMRATEQDRAGPRARTTCSKSPFSDHDLKRALRPGSATVTQRAFAGVALRAVGELAVEPGKQSQMGRHQKFCRRNPHRYSNSPSRSLVKPQSLCSASNNSRASKDFCKMRAAPGCPPNGC